MGYLIKPIHMSEEAKAKMRADAIKKGLTAAGVDQAGIKAVDELTSLDIANIRRASREAALRALLWQPFIQYKVPVRVENAIHRAYSQGYVTKPLNQLTNEELLNIRQIGPKHLASIRQVVPAP
jgi:hypothetical protein